MYCAALNFKINHMVNTPDTPEQKETPYIPGGISGRINTLLLAVMLSVSACASTAPQTTSQQITAETNAMMADLLKDTETDESSSWTKEKEEEYAKKRAEFMKKRDERIKKMMIESLKASGRESIFK
jgi:hypothetical protein